MRNSPVQIYKSLSYDKTNFVHFCSLEIFTNYSYCHFLDIQFTLKIVFTQFLQLIY